ncbi:MAG: hypothetical protein IKA69_06785 [Kiritimatiellae bacterium]|nr:hypothetical protein [Kiritimatiellia bacterium]
MTVLLAMVFAAALSAGNAEFDRTASEGAAKIAMARFGKSLAESGAAPGVLKDAMLADPGRFAAKSAAEAECLPIYVKSAEDAYAAEMSDVARRLSLPDDFRVELSERDRRGVEERFRRAFDEERREAVAAQAKGIVAATRPGEEEFESKDEDTLRREMAERIAKGQKTPVFEENLSYISKKMVDPVIAAAKAERKRQNEYLMRVRSDAVVPSKLAADIESRLRANVEERAKKADAANAWGVFPSVLSQGVPDAVERRILNRFAERIDEVRLDVTADEVANTVAGDPAAHAKASESEKLFVVAYSAKAISEAMELALSEVLGQDREELRGFLSARLQSGAVTKAVERLVRKEVMPKWREARAEAARKLAETTWPTLCDRTWYPPAELADETAARSDYSQAVRDWREVKGMESLAAADGGRPVMEEAEAKADERVAAAFDLARSAIAAQNEIVESSHAGVLAESRARKDSFWRRTPDLKAIAAMLTAATEDKWAERRISTLWSDGELPANADEQHAGLFPSVRRKIELMARMILEEMNEPVEQKPEESPPEEETRDDSISVEQPQEVQAFTISVSKNGDKVEAKLLKGKTPVVDKSVDARLQPFESAMREISTTLGRDLLNLR